MNRAVAMLLIGLVFGGGLGFVLAAANGVTLDGHDHATDHGQASVDHAALHETPLLIPADTAPSVEIAVTPDPVSGWNLRITTTNFAFSPENSGLDHVDGEGHAHVYANGVKLGRVYGDWYHISTLPTGEVEVAVTLTSNDHRPFTVGDVPVKATVTVNNPSGG